MSTIKSSAEDLTLNADGSNEVKFQINAVEKASINSSGLFTSTTIDATALTGNLPAISGASLTSLPSHSGNVAFPATQVASADANTLDDYEEGSWTPVLGGSGGQSGQSYSPQLGVYTKIGRIVHCSCYINLSTKGTITATLQLSGLPFTAGSGTGYNSAGSLMTINAWTIAAGTYVQFGINNNSATANFRSYLGTGSSADGANMTTANVNNGTHISLNITYAV